MPNHMITIFIKKTGKLYNIAENCDDVSLILCMHHAVLCTNAWIAKHYNAFDALSVQ